MLHFNWVITVVAVPSAIAGQRRSLSLTFPETIQWCQRCVPTACMPAPVRTASIVFVCFRVRAELEWRTKYFTFNQTPLNKS